MKATALSSENAAASGSALLLPDLRPALRAERASQQQRDDPYLAIHGARSVTQ